MTSETEKLVLAALRRVVKQAFNPPTKRHRRSGFAGSLCDGTCQPCAIEQARLALKAMENEYGELDNPAHICSNGHGDGPEKR